MSKKSFIVWQPAELWYKAVVEAESAEQAISMAKHPSFDGANWELDWDTLVEVDKPCEVEEVND